MYSVRNGFRMEQHGEWPEVFTEGETKLGRRVINVDSTGVYNRCNAGTKILYSQMWVKYESG